MTAYDMQGRESRFSNEINIPAAPLSCEADADCDDGNACNGSETCQSSTCVAGTAPVCGPPSQCMQAFCDPVSGCGEVPQPDGTSCDDGDPATMGDVCGTGVCRGTVAECMFDADCDDGNACNGVETCTSFACSPGMAPICPMSGECQTSFCDPALGCGQMPVPDGTFCDDGDPSSMNDTCTAGTCAGTVPECESDLDCEDANPCTVDMCDTDSTCMHDVVVDGSACYDFDAATIGDVCVAGTCEGTCRMDVDCPAGAARDHVLSWPFPTEPGVVAGFYLYLGFEAGVYGEAVDLGLVPMDANGVPFFPLTNLDADRTYYALVTAYDDTGLEWLVIDEFVIPALTCDNTPCNDGDPCTADACTAQSCTNDVLPDEAPCDDGDPDTVLDLCLSGVCTGLPPECVEDLDCDDGDACNGVERCQDFRCVLSASPVCPASTQCSTSTCEPAIGCQVTPAPDGTSCNDGDGMTVLDACMAGTCDGLVPDCTADVDCTDGDVCTGMETCQDYVCVGGTQLVCGPSTQCMDAFCDAVAGCGETARPDGSPCNDGDPFTQNDVCSSSGTVCAGTVPRCNEVRCEDDDFWCQLTKMLSELVGRLNPQQRRPCE